VTCGGQPCQAEIHLILQSDHNPSIKHVFSSTPDGRFEYKDVLNESFGTPVDWRLMVYTPRTYPIEMHGRQILADDTAIEITRAINLP